MLVGGSYCLASNVIRWAVNKLIVLGVQINILGPVSFGTIEEKSEVGFLRNSKSGPTSLLADSVFLNILTDGF